MIELSGGAQSLYRQSFAGDALNTAWHAKRNLPVDVPVSFFTAVGTDTMSMRMREFLQTADIGIERIVTVPDRCPGLYMIEQRDGDRHFTYWRDHSAARMLAEDDSVLSSVLAGQGMIYFSGITLAILSPAARKRLLRALATEKSRGASLAFDPNLRLALWEDCATMRRLVEEAATLCDVILPSYEDEATHFGDPDPGETCRRYATAGAGEIVVKDGPKPITLWQEGRIRTFAVPRLEQVIDATGAGDGFNGAYLAARLSGASAAQAIDRAIAVSVSVLSHDGAIPTVDLPWD